MALERDERKGEHERHEQPVRERSDHSCAPRKLQRARRPRTVFDRLIAIMVGRSYTEQTSTEDYDDLAGNKSRRTLVIFVGVTWEHRLITGVLDENLVSWMGAWILRYRFLSCHFFVQTEFF